MRRTALWMVGILAAALLGALAGVSWRERARPPQTAPSEPAAGEPETSAPAPASPAQPQTTPSGDPFLHIEGTTLSAADPAGRRLWDLRAAQLTMDNAKQRVVLRGVSGRFYRGAGVGITFSAPAAVFHVASRDVEMTGGVVGRAADGRVLRAAQIRWNAGARQIQAMGTVILTQRGVAIHADRLAADAGLDQVRFSGNVLVRVTE
jgi:LPS export ABC transporter protein LptC